MLIRLILVSKPLQFTVKQYRLIKCLIVAKIHPFPYCPLVWAQNRSRRCNLQSVLFFRGRCSSQGARGYALSGSAELIATCSFEQSSPAPGKHSPTYHSIEVFHDLSDGLPFMAGQLHRIYARVQYFGSYDADDLSQRE